MYRINFIPLFSDPHKNRLLYRIYRFRVIWHKISRLPGIDPKCWMRAAQDAPEWYRKVETGAEVFMAAWSTKRVNETNARHAKELFATLPFELP